MIDKIIAETSEESRIQHATEAVRDMTENLANELRPAARGLEPVMRRIRDEVCALTRQAPLQSLAIAFLLGVMIARRR